MSTKLYLRSSKTSGIPISGETNVFDLLEEAGASAQYQNVTGATYGERQWGYGGAGLCSWISPPIPAGGYTLESVYFSGWMRAQGDYNQTFRVRIFKYTPGDPPTITELGGSPFDRGTEVAQSYTEYLLTCNVSDTEFAEGDRILVRLYSLALAIAVANDLYLVQNAADGATGDSFVEISPDFPSAPAFLPKIIVSD